MEAKVLKSFVFLWFCLLLYNCDVSESYLFKDIPSIFPSRLDPPGLDAPEKLWWSKEITPDFHVCGRLSRNDLRLVKDAGFKSILSLFTYPDGDPEGNFGGESLPTTGTERKFVEETLDLQYMNLLDPLDEWASVEAVQKFTDIVPKLKKPALLRCDRGYTITFVTLLYFANQTRHNAQFEPAVSGQRVYDIAKSMGLDFLYRIPMEIVTEITGEPILPVSSINFLRPKYEPEDWLDFWFAHAVYKNWFIAGQITKSHLAPLKEFGYKTVINLRLGLTFEGTKSQEEVSLLNIKSGTGTYGDKKSLPRQNMDRLRQTRLDSKRSNSFISNTSELNFQFQNPREFGDEVGYNEMLESDAFKDSGLEYVHLPLRSKDNLSEFFAKHKEKLFQLGQSGPVLVHCSDGSRAAYVSVLAAANQYDLSLDWALQRLKEMGFGIASDVNPSVFNVYRELLPLDAIDHTEL